MIAGPQPGHARSDRLDDAGRLMAVDRRQFSAPGAVHEEDVAVADRAGPHIDENFAGAGGAKLDQFEAERRAEGAADGGSGFHAGSRRFVLKPAEGFAGAARVQAQS